MTLVMHALTKFRDKAYAVSQVESVDDPWGFVILAHCWEQHLLVGLENCVYTKGT
jgi:hypothetical protein